MGDRTAIEWTDSTWNPWQGCHKVSLGCKNCYMFREKTRYGQEPNVVVRSKPQTFNLPLRLKDPQRVFTCSWSDFFIEEADSWRDEAWEIIRRTPHLIYQIVTKRIERAAELVPWGNGEPWPNVWLIVSAENQETLDRRLPHLLKIPAVVKGLSLEPLLGPIDASIYFYTGWTEPPFDDVVNWVIVGGESGPRARPMHPDWVKRIRDDCQKAHVPFFFKQWGEWGPFIDNGPLPRQCSYVGIDGTVRIGDPEDLDGDACMGCIGKKAAGRELDGRRWDEFPEVHT